MRSKPIEFVFNQLCGADGSVWPLPDRRLYGRNGWKADIPHRSGGTLRQRDTSWQDSAIDEAT